MTWALGCRQGLVEYKILEAGEVETSVVPDRYTTPVADAGIGVPWSQNGSTASRVSHSVAASPSDAGRSREPRWWRATAAAWHRLERPAKPTGGERARPAAGQVNSQTSPSFPRGPRRRPPLRYKIRAPPPPDPILPQPKLERDPEQKYIRGKRALPLPILRTARQPARPISIHGAEEAPFAGRKQQQR